MSSAPNEFDPSDPIDAIGEYMRQGVLQVLLNLHKKRIYRDALPEQRIQGEIGGLLLGVCCAAQALTRRETHPEVQALLLEQLPFYFDSASSIVNETVTPMPLPASHGPTVQIRLQAIIAGMEMEDVVALLAGQIAVRLMIETATRSDADAGADRARSLIGTLLDNNFGAADVAALRGKRLAAARRAAN